MTKRSHRLELLWIGKDERPRLEPRVLLEDPALSYHAARRVTANDQFDNTLIFGDNLLALKALEQEYAGKVKCAFIDPPYNTGSAFEHYDDGVEHSLWLSLMRDRLNLLRSLLADDGSIWITIDDNEAHYLKVFCDEVFGRACFVAAVAWRSADSSNNDAKQFSVDHNTVLVYSRAPGWRSIPLPRTEDANAHYSNPDDDPRGPWFPGNVSSPNPRPNLRFVVVSPTGHQIRPPANGWRWSREAIQEKIESGEIVFSTDGTRLIRKTYLSEQGGLAPSTVWDDVEVTGHNRQAKYELKKLFPDIPTAELFATPKPERLVHRVLQIATRPGDLVLDSFAGSGTTGAVAHKMGRRWLMVEMGEHCHTYVIPRLKKVIDHSDPGGVTEATGWQGGGGFRYYRLAPSLLEKDNWGNWVISRQYNAAMLAEAVCKIEGFRYEPSSEQYWLHGRSSERDCIYVTTQELTAAQLDAISSEVGPDRTLLICCGSWPGSDERWLNLTLKKIPNAVLARCEFGRDDYSLQIRNLPEPEQGEDARAPARAGAPVGRRNRRPARAARAPDQLRLPDGE
ncbi:MAG TPA: site-specific DNA-methyltransferase [Gemmatimonadaceae bacterium]|nr:site-specific DNA-methyltransferase [Gemmatimonadaceae bacterium]